MKAGESASTLELGKYNQFREAYVLDVNKWDATTQDAIDEFGWWLRPMPAVGAPIDAE